MKINLCRYDWQNFRRGQERCFLLTNGLGGYSSLTVIGDTARGDHALLMAARKAPGMRMRLIANVAETLEQEGRSDSLYSQEFVNRTKNQEGFRYLESFEMEAFPTWTYLVKGIRIKKDLVMRQGENTIGIRYQIQGNGRPGSFHVKPLLSFTAIGRTLEGIPELIVTEECIAGCGIVLHQKTNGSVRKCEPVLLDDLYYEQDARDGREAVGRVLVNHEIVFDLDGGCQTFYLLYSLENRLEGCGEETVSRWMEEELARREKLLSRSGLKNPAGQALALSAFQYLTRRESTGELSILAGFPYFGDWGRDAMIALPGCTLALGLYDECKSVLRTFMSSCKKGLLPNYFPEDGGEPHYNTVDASLLFIQDFYEYYSCTGDRQFLEEAYPVMAQIIYWYCRGTDYHIRMDWDCLLMAGEGLEQLTWMDVRIGEELPTPRHGKPVEINAYWYNDLRIMEELAPLLGKDGNDYGRMADSVKKSFLENFWMEEKGWLKDVVNQTPEEMQFRCNQIFALALPYRMLSEEQGRRVIKAVKEQLYTPVGLRTLSPEDAAFHPYYGGSQPDRDRAYHQGTVWAYPLGAYYRAVLSCAEDEEAAKAEVRRDLSLLEGWLTEGCLFHLAEIYDGGYPTISKGCYAQAWSVGELVRVYRLVEE